MMYTYKDGIMVPASPISHKVGQIHHFGKILADAYKYDMSGNTVAMYEKTDKSGYNVVEWDKSGEYEISTKSYDTGEDATMAYVELTFGISV